MSAIEQGIGVLVPSVDERNRQILQVAVVRRGTNEFALWFRCSKGTARESSGIVDMLYDFRAVHQIERIFLEVLQEVSVRREDFKSTVRTALSRDPDTCLRKVDSYHAVSQFGELAG